MASDVFWRNGVVGNWFASENWVTGTVPQTGDTAIIKSGTAVIASNTDPVIIGQQIVLGGANDGSPVILQATDATFAGTASGTPEINTTITVSGAPAQTNAVFIAEGNTSFDGQIFVEAIAGSLTILVRSDGSDAGVFTLMNADSKAAVVVSQESFLDFEGQTVINHSLIQIEGGVEISAGVTITGSDGVFLLEDGGRLIVEGNIDKSQDIVFVDGTGKLTIENLAGFAGMIEYAELPTPPGQPPRGIAGGQIDLTEIQAKSLKFIPGSNNIGTLQLYAGENQKGGVVAELTMRMVTDNLDPAKLTLTSKDFTLSSNGDGGTLVTYTPQGSTYLLSSLPTPVIAEAGDVVSLESLLQDSFGTSRTPFEGVWLFPADRFENTKTNVGYWETSDITPSWYIGGVKVEKATFVTDISNVTLHAGNQIDNPASFQFRFTEAKKGEDAGWITYDVWTVDPKVIDAMADAGFPLGTPPSPEMVVAAANAFVTVYGEGTIPNTNLCNWIADNVAAGAGVTMPLPNTSFDPSLNVEGGFWRIVYASDIPDPVSDWSSLVQPGDIVRMGWFKPESGRVSGHSTTVLSTLDSEGKIQFYDNNDDGHIGKHYTDYWLNTDPNDITIYRLDPDQQYLINGTNLDEVIQGSVYDNLIRPGGGADIIRAKLGDTEIEGTLKQLKNIKAPDFNVGDSFHFTDLDPDSIRLKYNDGKLQIFDGKEKIAAIKVPKPGDGYSFIVTADDDGGARIELATPEIEVKGNGHVIADGDDTPTVTDGTDFGTVMRGSSVVHTFSVTNNGLAPLKLSDLKMPKGFSLVEGLASEIAPGESDTFEVRIDTRQAGFKEGTLRFTTNDADERSFQFELSGHVATASSPLSSDVSLLDRSGADWNWDPSRFDAVRNEPAKLLEFAFDPISEIVREHHGPKPGASFDFDLN